jgi:hypothetical protein
MRVDLWSHQKMGEKPTHTYSLPLGVTVGFSVVNDNVVVHWDPDVPWKLTFRSERAQNKLMNAYKRARSDFLKTLATVVGGSVIVMDPRSENHDKIEMEAVHPAVKH